MMSPRVKCLALLALLVVSSIAVSSAWRPDPAFHSAALATRSQPQVGVDCSSGGEEECLTRRTMEANIDYIYGGGPTP
ncbi:hypothetical protein BT93_L3484 [Corymbia citriodora subsp. variegata]|uniref:Phytosulfokine n=1 Tax=Corymbia citriodora subsp. variegata TaxID=360336 RepID=A0A8T0CVJ0_CORYI|nr:hypothetical protein BT93_L3484 [Corymbia citriodora subsp. variegata]